MQAVKAFNTTSKRVVEVLPQSQQICQGRRTLQVWHKRQIRQILGTCLRTGMTMGMTMMMPCRAWMTAHPPKPLTILQVSRAQAQRAQAVKDRGW